MPRKSLIPLADRQYLSIPEAARVFGISHHTIRRALRSGSLPHSTYVRWGDTAIRIDRHALAEHLQRTERIHLGDTAA
jgi:excisionase family DNA binding protein